MQKTIRVPMVYCLLFEHLYNKGFVYRKTPPGRASIAFSGNTLYFVSPMKQHLMAAIKSIYTKQKLGNSFDYFRIRSVYIHTAAKRIIFLMLVGQFLLLSMQAQTSHSRRKEDFDVHEFRAETIDIIPGANTVQLKNIRGITVMDARADTSAVGFMQKRVIDPFFGALNNAAKNQVEQRINKTPTFITMGSGLQQEAAQFLNDSVAFADNESLPGILMVIKKLWLSDELIPGKEEHVNSGTFAGPSSKDVWSSGIDVKIEFYLKDRVDYYPMYRYDSIISKAVTVSENRPGFIELALQLSMQKMLQMDTKVAGIMNRKKFSLEEICQHNKNDFNIPVLKEALLKPGVYMTFEEFKNNTPSQTGYEIKKDKFTDILYIKQPDGKEWVARDVWGYSNGENAYVKAGDNFFLLQRMQNAFYIFGAKNIKRNETSTAGAASAYSGNAGIAAPYYYTSSKTAIQLEPFQLDWSSGRLY